MTSSSPRVRRSLTELQDEHDQGDTKALDDLVRAWKGIQELPPEDPRSFWSIGGLHGEPFRGAGWSSSAYWGGWCNHGNVLFPTWHRAYLHALEEALRSVPGCADVTLPFWDETSADSLANGIPWALTRPRYRLDGADIPNPLCSFVLPLGLVDLVDADTRNPADPDRPDYSKAKGYQTVRYPLSGLVGTPADVQATAEHNARYPDAETNVALLNHNVTRWLGSDVVIDGVTVSRNVHKKYTKCLNAPNYTVFSNNSSATQWNLTAGDRGVPLVTPLESPHDAVHLAVGGFEIPSFDASAIDGANGDMGENDTAGLDPIFFLHHCFVDRMFWLWQRRHGAVDHLEVIDGYPGTNSVDGQGPTPGVPPNAWLTLDSPLSPFTKPDGSTYRSLDCINIETQLGYTYGPGSLEDAVTPTAYAAPPADNSTRTICVSGVDRNAVRGSFLISAFAIVDGRRHHVGSRAVLSRWNVAGCANCQTHVEARAFLELQDFPAAVIDEADVEVELRTRDGVVPQDSGLALAALGRRPFHVEIRDGDLPS